MDRKKHSLLLLMGLLMFAMQYASAQIKHGFVQQENIKISGILADSQIYALTVTQKQTTRIYSDGLGRAIQTIAVQASPSQKDIIQPIAYDNLGRQTKSYLAYGGLIGDTVGSYRINAISSAQPAFYNQTSQYIIPVDTGAYATQVFENSPLKRLLNSGLVGTGYHYGVTGAHYKTVIYRPNTGSDGNIMVWNLNGTFTSGSYYAAGTLAVTDGTDEDGAEALIFSDLAGHTILKRQLFPSGNLDTYYIYNMAGMISYIVPPKAVGLLSSYSYSLTATPINTLVFHFTYDSHGRMITKTVPSKGTLSIVYDPFNRPVLMQDANMHSTHTWNYIKYDAKGRAISQGIYTDGTDTTQSAMQSYVNGLTYSTWYESRYGTLTNNGYYTNNVFPTISTSPLAYSYYDDYDLNQDGTDDFGYVMQNDGNLSNEESATMAKLKGIPTIVSKTTVGNGLSSTWITTATFYDKRLNTIQVQSNNHVYYTGATTFTDTKTVVTDFRGVPQSSKIVKRTGSSTSVSVYTYMSYDHMYRVTGVSQRYNSGSSISVAAYTYNEMGQVIKKGLGYVNSTTWLQNVDMRYNIRGQLLSINNSKLTSDGGVINGDSNDVFGMQFIYDQTDSNLGNKAYFDGKLSAVKWMSGNGSGTNTYERAYKYLYDGVNRYTGAHYAERTTTGTGSFSNNIAGFDERSITYDGNGNILTLSRNSSTQGLNSNSQIDSLTYTYDNTYNPNRLLSVADASGSIAGFMAGSGTYLYDANGNLTNEPYKGISNIRYNTLNRTDKISFSSSANRYIDYTYDAGGNLIRKRQYDNSGGSPQLINTTDYVDGYVYSNGNLSYFPMPEGRVLYAYTSGTFSQEFIITDQQGNARVSFNNTGAGGTVNVVQEDSYYGFGMVLHGSTTSGSNKRLYNGGSEWQNDYQNLPDYYQTFNRNYDAALGRWIGVDPVAESAESMTGYQYAGNNPIMYNDPLGDLLPLPGSKTPPNGDWTPLYYGFGIPADIKASQDAFYGGGKGVYDSDPALAYFLAITNGQEIYHRGNIDTGDPSRGSLADGVALLNSLAANGGKPLQGTINVYIADDGKVLGQHFVPDPRDGDGGVHFFRASTSMVGGVATIVGDGEITPLEAFQQLTGLAKLPTNDGFVGEGIYGEIAEGQIISRFGGTGELSRFFSLRGTPAALRSLLKGTNLNVYQEWRVIRAFQVKSGPIANNVGNPTGAIQMTEDGTITGSKMTIQELEEQGYIKEIENAEIPIELP